MSRPLDFEPDLVRSLERLNQLLSEEAPGRGELEAELEHRFAVSGKLAIYGSLAPGQENHSVIEAIPGTWRDGFVRGVLHDAGWGTTMGYPAMKWDPGGDRIPVNLFESSRLVDHWARLDGFEGEDYVRILVPVEIATGGLTVANIYAYRT